MSFRIAAFLLLLVWTGSAFAQEEAQPKATPGIFKRTISHMNPFHRDSGKAPGDSDAKARSMGLELTVAVSPQPLKLSESHQLQVTLVLTNHSKNLAQLEFPTTQRIEVLLRNEAGKVINQWSEDQSFSSEQAFVTLNPREHVEYTASISGRDMVAGKSYTVEGFLPNYKDLKVSKKIVPLP